MSIKSRGGLRLDTTRELINCDKSTASIRIRGTGTRGGPFRSGMRHVVLAIAWRLRGTTPSHRYGCACTRDALPPRRASQVNCHREVATPECAFRSHFGVLSGCLKFRNCLK
jgi:hypothetical protein